MALIYIKEVCAGVRLGLWRMDEEPAVLLGRYPHLRLIEMPFKNTGRQKEFLSVRALLMEMTGDDTLRIDHTASGRPLVEGWKVSISHTRGYAALMLSQEKVSGVDIEYRSERIVKIASHFIRPDEMVWRTSVSEAAASGDNSPTAETVIRMLILWCAKETLYKLYSDDDLHFFDMRQVASCDDLNIVLENMKRGERVPIHVTLTPEYCLTWAVNSEL